MGDPRWLGAWWIGKYCNGILFVSFLRLVLLNMDISKNNFLSKKKLEDKLYFRHPNVLITSNYSLAYKLFKLTWAS